MRRGWRRRGNGLHAVADGFPRSKQESLRAGSEGEGRTAEAVPLPSLMGGGEKEEGNSDSSWPWHPVRIGFVVHHFRTAAEGGRCLMHEAMDG